MAAANANAAAGSGSAISDRQASPRITVSMRNAKFPITLPSVLQSPELTIVTLSGRKVFHKALNVASGKAVENEIVYDCAGSVMPAGVYIAVVNDRSGDPGALSARTKFAVNR
jgi:hypothetical protein